MRGSRRKRRGMNRQQPGDGSMQRKSMLNAAQDWLHRSLHHAYTSGSWLDTGQEIPVSESAHILAMICYASASDMPSNSSFGTKTSPTKLRANLEVRPLEPRRGSWTFFNPEECFSLV